MWQPGATFYFLVAAYVAAHMVTVPGASDRRVSLSVAVAGAAVLTNGGSLVLVLGAAAVALPINRLIVRSRHGQGVIGDMFPAETTGIVALASAFAAATLALPSTDPTHPAILPVFVGAAIFGFLVTVTISSVVSNQGPAVARRLLAMRALRDWPAYASLYSSAALYAVTVEQMGGWSVPLAGLPYLFSHVSLHRLQDTRRTYDQTIRALGAISEASDQVVVGSPREPPN